MYHFFFFFVRVVLCVFFAFFLLLFVATYTSKMSAETKASYKLSKFLCFSHFHSSELLSPSVFAAKNDMPLSKGGEGKKKLQAILDELWFQSDFHFHLKYFIIVVYLTFEFQGIFVNVVRVFLFSFAKGLTLRKKKKVILNVYMVCMDNGVKRKKKEMQTTQQIIMEKDEETNARDEKMSREKKLASVANLKNMDKNATEGTNSQLSDAIVESEKASKQKKHKILILDWDNTILPSDSLERMGYKLDNEKENLPQELLLLESKVCEFLTLAIDELSCDNVIVITNAQKGWVELSALRFLPQCVRLLKRLHILSARSMFEQKYSQAYQWKHRCMHFIMQKCWGATLPHLDTESLKHVMKTHMQSYLVRFQSLSERHWGASGRSENNHRKRERQFVLGSKCQSGRRKKKSTAIHSISSISLQRAKQTEELRSQKELYVRDKRYHIISVGDSWTERNACLVFGDILSNVFVKSIKLKESPSIAQASFLCIHVLALFTFFFFVFCFAALQFTSGDDACNAKSTREKKRRTKDDETKQSNMRLFIYFFF
ncbi:hypothetical protein RFI_28653 [Reticulomyxa filosa]|uniref:Uncharacterized protein n=1 Tax=Reticulomyxa filosa TaxID=46433 RepID=X6M6T4_RETFI|nr:hypothetical protein RFI_28653 [Reticulomyxa filosa]|eukprot:ETO08735.1 hypothetical protein RFI_28653 [Reticulomyxa filosa]